MTKFNITHDSPDKLQNAGLLLNDDVVVIDFDNDNDDEQRIVDYLLKNHPTQMVETTRGYHLYYSKPRATKINNGSDRITAGGFQVDYKTGSSSYVIVKLNGIDRKGSKNLKLTGLPELPPICYPLSGVKNLTGMSNHDGRNSAIFYHLRCLKEQYSYVNPMDVAFFINNYCFRDSMDVGELESTVSSVTKTESSHSTKDLVAFAKFIAYELDVKIYQGRLYHSLGSKYVYDDLALRRAVNDRLSLNRHQWKELENQLFMVSELIDNSRKFKIRVRNGFIDSGQVHESKPEFTPFFLDVDYDPNIYNQHVDKFLNEITCNRKELRLTLEEILGHCLMTHGFPHKVFFLLGRGRNGKSTFLEMINNFSGNLGSNVGLTSFDDPTSLASMIGKIVNCSDDIDSDRIEKSKIFKSISAGNSVSVRPIYSKPIDLVNTATLIVNANELPMFRDKSLGLVERLFVVPFNLDLTKRQMDATLLDKLSTENAKTYILNLALKGMASILKDGKITPNQYTVAALAAYKRESDSLGAFLDSRPIEEGSWLKEVYARYNAFCEYDDLNVLMKATFSKSLKRHGYKLSTSERNPKVVGNDNRDRRIFLIK
jgi:putative DNA primase/helicase